MRGALTLLTIIFMKYSVYAMKTCYFCVDTSEACQLRQMAPIEMSCTHFTIINQRSVKDYITTPTFWKEGGGHFLAPRLSDFNVTCINLMYQKVEKAIPATMTIPPASNASAIKQPQTNASAIKEPNTNATKPVHRFYNIHSYSSVDDSMESDHIQNFTFKSCVYKDMDGKNPCEYVESILKEYNMIKLECCTCDQINCNFTQTDLPNLIMFYFIFTFYLLA